MIACRWCKKPATTTVTTGARAADKTVIGCCDQCWARTYDAVKTVVPRSWNMLVQAQDLLDFLPQEEDDP
jgi:hypothetical protein